MWISLKDVYIIHEIKLWLFCFMYRMYNHEFEAIFFKVIYLSIVLFIYFSGGQSIVVFNYENRLFQKKKKNYENRCNESIWLGSTPAISDVLDPEFTSGTSNTLQMPDQRNGFIWGRSKCSFNDSNNFSCEAGACGNEVFQWPVANSPVTILNFTVTETT